MEDPEDPAYAPQSPDLTATSVPDQFDPHPQHREYRGSVSFSPFTPTSETKTPFAFPPSAHSSYPPQAQPQPQAQLYYSPQQQILSSAQPFNQQYNPYFANAVATAPHPAAHYAAPAQPYPQHHQHPAHIKHEDCYYSEDTKAMPAARGGKKAKKAKKEEDVEVENNAPGVREGIEVRTKFPVARIKRIMQADEDVGKVAQVTPVAVCKFSSASPSPRKGANA